jgi:hypothetical protein
MTIMDGGEGNTIAAYDAAARKLVLVTMNYITAQNITYNLAGFYKVAGPIRRWMTATGTGVKYAQSSNPSLNSQQFTVAFATNTIQTFEVQNVDLNPPPLLNGKLSSSNNQITLTWPLWTAGYKLYANSNLAVSSGWQLVTNLPSTNTGSFSVSLPSSKPGRQFFRLSNP